MTDVTKEMILDYLVKKGGVVKNVDLVRHFRKYLQVENSALKGTKQLYLSVHVAFVLLKPRASPVPRARRCWLPFVVVYGCFSCWYARTALGSFTQRLLFQQT